MENTNTDLRADATIASQATGAMSWAFISAIKANPKQSYVQLLNSVRDVLETKYTQKPQLSSSHPIGTFSLCVHHPLFAASSMSSSIKPSAQKYAGASFFRIISS